MSTRTYLIGQGYDNLRKHGGKTFSTMLIICATMFVLGIFIIAFVNIESNVKSVSESQGLQAFISDDVLDSQVDKIAEKINQMSNVKNIKYIDKAGALEDAKETLKDYAYLLDGLEQINPFPRSFVVTFENLKSTSEVKTAIESVDGIYKVGYNETIINAVVSISKIGNYVIIGLGAVMILLSIFIISNTIKLAVYSNKREIYIMKYIGATAKFIKYPFIVEGILMGLGAAIVSWIIVSLGYTLAYTGLPKIGAELGVFGFVGYSKFWYIELGAFVLLGVLLGGIGSAVATKKYLKEFKPVKITKKNKYIKQNSETKKDVVAEQNMINTSRTGRVGAIETIEAEQEDVRKLMQDSRNAVKLEKPKETDKELERRKKQQQKAEIKEKKLVLKREEEEKKKAKKEGKQEFERKRKARRLSGFLLITIIGMALMPVVSAATTADKIDQIDKQTSAAAKEYEKVKSDIKVYEADVKELDGEVEKYSTSVDELTAKVNEVTKEVEVLETELQNVSSNYEATEQLLNTRLRALYENNFVNIWEMLFSSENTVDFLAKYNVLITLIQYDQKMLTAMQSQKEYINNLRESADLRKLQVEQVQYDVRKSKEALESAKANKTAKVTQLQGSETKLKNILANLRAERAKQEKILAQEIAAAKNNNIVFTGEFTWPAPGVYYISAIFRDKEYYNWAGSVHKGTDIAKGGGCNIVAAQSGTVIVASGVGAYNGGYGNYVIIDHGTRNGSRYVTLYGHLASVSVSKGQAVVKGQKIGYMGSTGWSTGTHLHFEIRKNGVQINAMNYFGNLAGVAKYYSYGKWIPFPFSNMGKYMI